jgi:hypothetical protein
VLPHCCVQRVSKLPYKPDEADEFERAWLALADIHIAGGKFDLAQVRLRICPACTCLLRAIRHECAGR